MRGLGCSQELFLSHYPPPSLLSSAPHFCLYLLWSPFSLPPSITGLSLFSFSSSHRGPSAHLTPVLSLPLLLPCPLPTCPGHMPPDSGSLQGGTDLEKHRDLLMWWRMTLRQEMRRCEAELQELRAKPRPLHGLRAQPGRPRTSVVRGQGP